MAYPRPLALGLVRLPAHASRQERLRARVELALAVNERGYALVDSFDLGTGGPGGLGDEEVLGEVEALLRELEVQSLVLSGPVDVTRVRRIADHARVLVWQVTALAVCR